MSEQRAQAGQSKQMIIFSGGGDSLEELRRFAEWAQELGATHLDLSGLPRHEWMLSGRRDPYPYWPMCTQGLLHIATPPELAEWLPAERARRSLEILAERSAVLREVGLRATFLGGNEPMFLPPEVFLAHPEWRGAECQLPVIASEAYWCPSLDNPEVLDMYRRAMAEICQAAPELDLYQCMSNDSGAGVDWGALVYPGQNGPWSSRDRPMGERIVGFYDALQAGAAEAGGRLQVHMNAAFTSTEIEAVLPHLKEGQAFCGRDREGRPFSAGAGGHDFFSNHVWPLVGQIQPERFVRSLEQAQQSPAPRLTVSMPGEISELPALVSEALRQPPHGPRERQECLHRFAAGLVGEAQADDLLEAWTDLERGIHTLQLIRNRGFHSILLVGTATQRWLNRPFVPFPERLTEDEKHYYRRHQFTAKGEERALDLQDILGRPGIVGQAAVWMAWRALDDTEQEFQAALRRVEKLREELEGEAQEYAGHFSLRLRMLLCLVRNAHNAVVYQDILNNRDAQEVEVFHDDWYGNLPHDRRGILLRRWGRAELDNTAEVIRLLEESPIPLLAQAPTNVEEDVFRFGPDLVHQLRKKIEIMMAHWYEAEEAYPTG